MPEQNYVINIPGATDIIRIPALEDKSLKQARYLRMIQAAETSTIPEPLRWIPTAINYLDDAQDLLFTALVLSKPLLRRLPARLIPGLGWILTANDLLNAMTAVLGSAVTGKSGKPESANVLELMFGGREKRLSRVANFMGKTPWGGFLLQAGQAMESLTGYGISLGAIMGALTDTIWAPIRAAQGAQITVQGPPPADPYGKALRYITQHVNGVHAGQIFSKEDHELTIAAASAAMQIIIDRSPPDSVENRLEQLQNDVFPNFEPWSQTSREVLTENKVDLTKPLRPFTPTLKDNPTFLQVSQISGARYKKWEQEVAARLGKNTRSSIFGMLNDQGGEEIAKWLIPGRTFATWDPDEITRVYLRAMHLNIWPIDWTSTAQLRQYLILGRQEAIFSDHRSPSEADLKRAAIRSSSGWTRLPFLPES